MPYASAAQRRFLHAQEPEVAEKWDKKYGGKIRKKGKRSKVSQEAMARRMKGGRRG